MKVRLFSQRFLLTLVLCVAVNVLRGQRSYWQQRADYTINVDVDAEAYQYKGVQKLEYTNNSPDKLEKVYFHLYPNAFQPGSEMDAVLQGIPDPDHRMVTNVGTKEAPIYKSRISELKPNEIGYIKINSLYQGKSPLEYSLHGTVVEVNLKEPLGSGDHTVFKLEFSGQVPLQIRRSGRNSEDGVALSMTQWFPKIAEYDYRGWHANPYLGREFYGVWGNYDVSITIPSNYILGATGVLENRNQVGYGYQDQGVEVKKQRKGKTTWHFLAKNVHDFAWTADPEYTHDVVTLPEGTSIHFLYKGDDTVKANWKKIQPEAVKTFAYFNKNIGKYPWEQYSILQGGDGGMEYAMCTLVAGGRNFEALLATVRHEVAHAWFQHALATDESSYAWMDEGFTSYISEMAKLDLSESKSTPFRSAYGSYYDLVKSGLEEPMTTNADRFSYNFAYSVASYIKGLIYLSQLGYIIGEDHLKQTIKAYYEGFKFKHPTPIDINRVAEKISGMHLYWYLNDWTETTKTIDYAIKSVQKTSEGFQLTLSRVQPMPMPIDLTVTYADGSSQSYHVPLTMAFGHKPLAKGVLLLPDWSWAYPEYTFNIKTDKPIKQVEIDQSQLMADVNRKDNTYLVKP